MIDALHDLPGRSLSAAATARPLRAE